MRVAATTPMSNPNLEPADALEGVGGLFPPTGRYRTSVHRRPHAGGRRYGSTVTSAVAVRSGSPARLRQDPAARAVRTPRPSDAP